MFSLALVLGSALLVAFGWALWSTMEGATRATQWVLHTPEVLERVDDIAIRSTLLEFGSVASAAAANPDGFRQTRQNSLRTLLADVQGLVELTNDNPAQESRSRILKRRIDTMAGPTEQAGVDVSAASEPTNTGNLTRPAVAAADVKSTLQSIKDEEGRLLAARLKERDDDQQRTRAVILAAATCCAALLVMSWWGFRREAIRQASAERRFRDLVQALPVSIWLLRTGPDRRLKFEFVSENVHAARHLGVEVTDAGYERGFASIHTNDRAAVTAAIEMSLQILVPYDVRFRVPDGDTVYWVHSAGSAKREPDGTVWTSGYWQDVDKEHALQEPLSRAMEQARAANQAKGGFLARRVTRSEHP